jgi:hypothetical protein
MQNVLWQYDILSVSSNTRNRKWTKLIGIKEDLVYIRVPYLQYIIEEVWVLVKQPSLFTVSNPWLQDLDLFSKHTEMNFGNFITVSLSVDFIIS